jgi:hypothetical protein
MRNINLQHPDLEGNFSLIAKHSTFLKIKHVMTAIKPYESYCWADHSEPFFMFLAMFRDTTS